MSVPASEEKRSFFEPFAEALRICDILSPKGLELGVLADAEEKRPEALERIQGQLKKL